MKKAIKILIIVVIILAVVAAAVLGYLCWYNSTHYIGRDAALSAAIADAGYTADQVYDTHAELEVGHGSAVYEVEFKAAAGEYDYVINAVTGAVLHSGMDTH